MAIIACTSVSAFAQFRVEGGYTSQKVSDDEDDEVVTLSGVKLGAYYTLNDVVLEGGVLESGVTFSLASGKKYGTKFKHADFAIPVNVGYAIKANDNFSIRPYAGINLKLNTKFEASVEGITMDMLDEKLMESDVRKFQFGGQIGAVCQWNKFTLSYQFQSDFNDLYKDDGECKFHTNAITIGYVF